MRLLKVLTLAAAALTAGVAHGDTPQGFPEFKAKRIKAHTGGKRNWVQIDPSQQVRPAPRAKAAEPPSVPSEALGRYSWFWDRISPDMIAAGPGRLETAMSALAAAGDKIPSPRLQHMQSIAKANGVEILKSTIGTQVSPALVLAVITVESAGKSDAVSRAGAQGLMQLMPATAARFGVTDSLAATQNIAGGVKYLDWLMSEFGRDPILVLAGYNAGEGSVRKHEGVPPFAETRDYVPKVLAAFQVARGLCRTPPELISDGCVFAAMK